jgi:hypothetical protein
LLVEVSEPFERRFGFVDAIGAPQRQEAGAEQFRVERRGVERRGDVPAWVAPLDAAADLDEPGCEPTHDMEPVQHVTGVGKMP